MKELQVLVAVAVDILILVVPKIFLGVLVVLVSLYFVMKLEHQKQVRVKQLVVLSVLLVEKLFMLLPAHNPSK